MEAAAATVSPQLSCFSSFNRNSKFQLQRQFILSPTFRRPKLSIVMNGEGRGMETPGTKTTLSYSDDASSNSWPEEATKYSSAKEVAGDEAQESGIGLEPKRAAKIHDFCFGIPYGVFVLSGGLIGFLFSRKLTTLSTGVLFGGALLALSTLSLKIWRQGKSSLPFILGQAALSAVLLWKSIQAYSLSKKLIPSGFYVAISAAMLFFYSYVVISGGNPPPKKLKSSASVAS
ncbi:hypothetical protein HS088_TW05G00696 [Tripterygium wilfordii]|uniref:Uncharacterized protein n=1 Tax=Tripterygium wilfordii TaxID=458696 RepID=A0A7J7DNM7_TRIWF|nr:protein FATTY ACID EXPORT 1, chloroplastic-like isoform X2 [Tripterygium wilfordii]KAF5747965.1 hypothetical protein HS088_TW05G00696 [Tripterygium wilfordii]